MIPPVEQLCAEDPTWQNHCQTLRNATSLMALVWISWQMGLWLAREVIQQQLHERAQAPTQWPTCSKCGKRLHSKGFRDRQILTRVGWIYWKRRVGRCPKRCQGSQRTPLDEALGIDAYQQTSNELVRWGCLLSIFLPFELASTILHQLTGVKLSEDTLWQWVQIWGQRAMAGLESQLQQMPMGRLPSPEVLEPTVAQMILAIAADGVMAPFRPHVGTPQGKTVWREVKVAILARLGQHLTRSGELITRLHHRRLVAVLGDINALAPRLMLEALTQGIVDAPQVVWLSDGGRGFWGLYHRYLAWCAVGILDFYHAAGQLGGAIKAYWEGRTTKAKAQFQRWRHLLRQGEAQTILTELAQLAQVSGLKEKVKQKLHQVHDYLSKHQGHINYPQFKCDAFPLGSGMVESACKWLIQQRFKGVGMRWSESGFNHLLHLRLAWVNERFDDVFDFDEVSFDLTLSSPNR